MATGAWGTEVVERTPIKAIPLIDEVHIDGLVRESKAARSRRVLCYYSRVLMRLVRVFMKACRPNFFTVVSLEPLVEVSIVPSRPRGSLRPVRVLVPCTNEHNQPSNIVPCPSSGD